MKKEEGNIQSRREFLKSSWKFLGLLAIIEGVIVSFSFMRARHSKGVAEKKNLKVAGSLSLVPPGTVMPFHSGRFYLVRLDDGGLMAISMVCTHLGCTVNWDSTEKTFKCPCHSSVFDSLGNVIKSPAGRALNYHRVVVDNGQVLVDLDNFIVKKRFDPSVVTYA